MESREGKIEKEIHSLHGLPHKPTLKYPWTGGMLELIFLLNLGPVKFNLTHIFKIFKHSPMWKPSDHQHLLPCSSPLPSMAEGYHILPKLTHTDLMPMYWNHKYSLSLPIHYIHMSMPTYLKYHLPLYSPAPYPTYLNRGSFIYLTNISSVLSTNEAQM